MGGQPVFRAVLKGQRRDWLLAGFAVGCGFLAKYLNALELISFLAFLLMVPKRRQWLRKPEFWMMLGVVVLCTTPVLCGTGSTAGSAPLNWNIAAISMSVQIDISTFLNFLALQAVVISPLLFFRSCCRS